MTEYECYSDDGSTIPFLVRFKSWNEIPSAHITKEMEKGYAGY